MSKKNAIIYSELASLNVNKTRFNSISIHLNFTKISINDLYNKYIQTQVFVAISSIFLGVVYPISSGSFPPPGVTCGKSWSTAPPRRLLRTEVAYLRGPTNQGELNLYTPTKYLPWEPTTFIFRGYNPYNGGFKPSFFIVLGSQG